MIGRSIEESVAFTTFIDLLVDSARSSILSCSRHVHVKSVWPLKSHIAPFYCPISSSQDRGTPSSFLREYRSFWSVWHSGASSGRWCSRGEKGNENCALLAFPFWVPEFYDPLKPLGKGKIRGLYILLLIIADFLPKVRRSLVRFPALRCPMKDDDDEIVREKGKKAPFFAHRAFPSLVALRARTLRFYSRR